MTLQTRISNNFEHSSRLTAELAALLAPSIANAAAVIVDALLKEQKVLACGTGGAAAIAQYGVALMLNQFELERPGLSAISLCSDSVTLTAIADENHFDQVFSKQVIALGMEGDILLAISSHGTSASITGAIRSAQEQGMRVIALTGGDDGKVPDLLGEHDVHIGVPHDDHARIIESFLLTLHCLCDAVDSLLLGVYE
jgi:D-sedoheptulose 7-phosphate isomerase